MASELRGEAPEGVTFTHLDEPLFPGSGSTKRQLVEYLDGVSEQLVRVLEGRPLSVIRVHRGEGPFMQKNVPKYTPGWVPTVKFWAEASKREVSYALCNDRPTLLWFANQRAVEYHPALVTAEQPERVTHLVLDLDPPDAGGFKMAVKVAHLARQVLVAHGLDGAAKTSGAKGLHIFVPLKDADAGDAAAATRAIALKTEQMGPEICTTAFMKADRSGKVFVDSTRAGGATVVAAYSPRARPNVPVSFPVRWEELDDVNPGDFTIRTALARLAATDPWAAAMPERQTLSEDLVAQGHAVPLGRTQAMHEGKRRARQERDAGQH